MTSLVQAMGDSRVQPDTHARYQRAYALFLNWIGDDQSLAPNARVPVLLQYLGRLVLNDRIPTAQSAAAAIAFFWKSKLGFDPASDASYAAFLRGLRNLKPLLSTPLPRRNELPVWALLHFYKQPPATIDVETHVLICAALAYGMRGIQRGGQIADLECCDISTISLQASAAAPPVSQDELPPGLALSVVIRVSKTDPNGLRPQNIVIDQGLSVIDPIRLINNYVRRTFGITLLQWNGSFLARARLKFFTLRGQAISTTALREWVRLVAAHARLEGYFGSHSLRIAGACWAALGGLSLETIMAMGGWRSQSSTVIYLRSLIAAVAGASRRMGF